MSHEPTDWPWAVDLLSPTMEAVKRGTEHEHHDGWQMCFDKPEIVQCGCGASLDDLVTTYGQRQRQERDVSHG